MAAQTAIEYGGRRVRLMQFDGSGRKLRVLGIRDVDLAVVETGGPGESDPDDLRAAAIAEAMSDAGFVSDPSAMAFDAGHAMFREFDLPFTNDEQIQKVVKFEAESYFPGDIDDHVVQHLVLRRTRDKSHILAVAVRKDDLLDRLDILDESGLDPMIVDIDVFALLHALIGTGIAARHERFVVIHAQESTTSLMFLEGGRLYAVRSIRIGSHGVGHDEGAVAEEALETARTHDYLARLVREIRRTLTTLPDAGTPEVVYLTGTGSLLPGFVEAVAGVIDGDVQPLDLLEHVDHKLSDDEQRRYGPDIGVALGIAFKLNGLDETHTDFRREEAAYTRKFDQVKTPLIVLSFLMFLIVAFFGLDAFMRVEKQRTEYARICSQGFEQFASLLADREAAEARLPDIAPGPKLVQATLDAVSALREETAGKLGRSTAIPDLPSALGVWIDFFEMIRRNEETIGRFALERLQIDAASRTPTIKLTGELEDQTRYQQLLDILAAKYGNDKVTAGGTKQTSSGMRFMDLTIEVKPEMAQGTTS
jgi:Tfp pilus assembly PilM family ATPase